MRALPVICLIALIGVTQAGCSSLPKFGLRNSNKNAIGQTNPGRERISLVPDEDQLKVATELSGIGYYLPPPAPVDQWPLPGGTPEQSVEHAAAAPDFQVAWTRDIGAGTTRSEFITAPPVAAGGYVYTMDAASRVTATDARTGAQVWSVRVGPETGGGLSLPEFNLPVLRDFSRGGEDHKGFGGGLAFDGGRLYVSSGFRFMAALNAATGAVVWNTPVDTPIHAAPTVSGGRVFVVNTDNELLTFDAATGAPGWTYQALLEPARILKASSPAVTGDTVVASFASGELVALRTSNGNELWSGNLIRVSRTTAISEIRDIPGRPVIYRGDVYAGSHSGAFDAVDLRTGDARWQVPLATIDSPWAAGDVVFAVDKDGEVVCIARSSGLVYWITKLNGEKKNVTTVGRFSLRNLTGRAPAEVLWSGPILASNRLITVSSDGRAAALDPKTGEVQGYIKLPGPALMAPIAASGMIYVVTDNGKLVAIR